MARYILDARNIPVKDRVVSPTQVAQQRARLLQRILFNFSEIYIEVRDESNHLVDYFMMRRSPSTLRCRLHIILPITGDRPPNVEGLHVPRGRYGQEFNHETASMLVQPLRNREYFSLNIIVGCQPLMILRHVLEKKKVLDIGGPYSGVILLGALARGPMATRLVLEYGASRFLRNNQRVSLQALIHYSCLGDPKTNRTAHMLWQEGVLQSDDLPELEKTLATYRNINRTLRESDVQTMERVAAMVEAVKTPPS